MSIADDTANWKAKIKTLQLRKGKEIPEKYIVLLIPNQDLQDVLNKMNDIGYNPCEYLDAEFFTRLIVFEMPYWFEETNNYYENDIPLLGENKSAETD